MEQRQSSSTVGGITDKEFVEPIRTYFQTILAEGKRYIGGEDDDDDDDEDDDDDDIE